MKVFYKHLLLTVEVFSLTVRAEIITELILKRAGPGIFKTFLLVLIAFSLFRPIPVICPARGVEPENYRKRYLIPNRALPAKKISINSWKYFSGSAIILVPTVHAFLMVVCLAHFVYGSVFCHYGSILLLPVPLPRYKLSKQSVWHLLVAFGLFYLRWDL